MSERRFLIRALEAVLRRLRQPAAAVRVLRDPASRVATIPLLAGRKALVTGAGRNIGRAIARELAQQGAEVYFTDLDAAAITAVEAELATLGARGRGFRSDVSAAADIERLCDALEREGVIIDILVNNVGRAGGLGSLQTLELEEMRALFDTNVFGPLLLTKRVVAAMIAAGRPGSILFLSSIHQERTFGHLPYSASKAALGLIVKELALELAAANIRVNGIAPGAVGAEEGGELKPIPTVPLHQSSIHPSYIGRAAVYLAADYFSQFTTGTVLTIDAGVLSRTPFVGSDRR